MLDIAFDRSVLLQDALSLVARGGPVMAVLVGLSVLALAIILAKLLQFRAQLRRTRFIEPAIADLARERERDRAPSPRCARRSTRWRG